MYWYQKYIYFKQNHRHWKLKYQLVSVKTPSIICVIYMYMYRKAFPTIKTSQYFKIAHQ